MSIGQRSVSVVGSLAGSRPVVLHGVDALSADVTVEMGKANQHGVSSATVFGTTAAALGTAGAAAAKFNGKYDGLNFGSGGVALTYAGFTLGANAIGGRVNYQLALAPQGGVPEVAYTVGLKYVTGPLTFGVAGEIGWYQGDPRLTGLTQRRGRGILAGVSYNVAPGL